MPSNASKLQILTVLILEVPFPGFLHGTPCKTASPTQDLDTDSAGGNA
jgi:hypothetical protein